MTVSKQLFLEIEDRIKEMVPSVKYIDLNMGQFEQPLRPSVAFPAVLIDFTEARAEVNHNWRRETVTVRLWIVCESYAQSQQSAPLNIRHKAMEYLDVTEQVIEALHLWQSTATTRLIYLSQRGQNIPEYRMRELTFQTSWVKSKAE